MRCAFAIALLVIWPALAQAQAPPGTNRASVSQVLFLKGREAFDRNDFATAERYFRRSYELDEAAGTLLNLALSEAEIGKLSEAWQHAREVIDELPPDDARLPIAQRLLESLEVRVPRLQLMLDGRAPTDAVVELDGILLEGVMLGTEIPVNPGSHDVVVRAPGRRVRHVVIAIEEGQRLARIVAPGPPAPAPVSKTRRRPQESSSASGWQGAGIGLTATGGAALLAGLVLGGLVLDRKNTVDEHCDESRRCDDEAFAAAAEGKRFSAASTGLSIGGLALSAAGAITLIVAPRTRMEIHARPGETWAGVDVTF